MKTLDNPCETCGWKYPGFHVCLDLSVPVDPKVSRRHVEAHNRSISPSHLEALQEGKTERWRRHREETAERDAKIVLLYREGMGIKPLSREFKIAFQTIQGVLRRAEARGEVTVRPHGYNGKNKEVLNDVRQESSAS